MSSSKYAGTPYTLYYNRWSLCSTQARYLCAIRGEPKDVEPAMDISYKEIDIYNEEQLSEHFLCNINPRGEVPVLDSDVAFKSPLPETVAIGQYVAERHPDLLPSEHAREIVELGARKAMKGMINAIERRLNDEDISEHYRKALYRKLDIQTKQKLPGLEPGVVAAEKRKAEEYLKQVAPLLGPKGPWLFGRLRPTWLDADLVVLIARLRDVDLHELIPDSIVNYGARAMSTPEWQTVMEGRTTMVPGGRK